METLPALKITHFNGEPARGQVYAYLRCYVRDGEIPFSVTVFDETPPHTARFGFAVTLDDAAGTYLFASCTKQQGDALWLYRTGEPADVPVCSPLRRSARRSAVCPGWAASCPGTPFCMTFPNRRSARRFLCPQVRAFPPQPGSAPSSWCLIDRRVSFRSVPFFHRRIPLFRICRQMPAY